MPHLYPPHHGHLLHARQQAKREHYTESVYANLRRDLSSGSEGDIYGDSIRECGCVTCQLATVCDQATQQEPFLHQKKARLMQQNIIQQNISLAPDTRCVRRRESKPAILILNSIFVGHQVFDRGDAYRAQHGHKPHEVNGSRVYNETNTEEKETRKTLEAREGQMRGRTKILGMQEKRPSDREKQLNTIYGRKTKSDSLEMAANKIRRDLAHCDADLKRYREQAAQEAQSRLRQDRTAVLPQEDADRREALEYDWILNKKTAKHENEQPKSILVKKKTVNFVSLDVWQ